MSDLRLAYLCGEYPRATDTFIQREVRALRDAGLFVDTISVRRPHQRERGTHEQEEERTRTHYLLPCSPWRLVADHARLMLRSPARYLASAWLALTVRSPGLRSLLYQCFYFAEAGMVASYMKRHRLIHLHNHAPDASGYVTMLAAQLGDFTYSMTLHGFGILSEPQRWRLSDKLERCLFAICVSWYARSQAMLWSKPDYWNRYHVVHCGVEVEQIRARVHKGTGRRLLFVGRFDHVKGLPLLLDAMLQLVQIRPDICLDLAGDGPDRPMLEQLVREKGLQKHVTFHGYVSQAKLRALQQQVDICAITSFAEGIPVVLMEAMAAGLPVVAPRITGIPELVEEGVSGFLYTPGRVDELVNRICRLLECPELRNEFGSTGRSIVEREFALNDEVRRLVQIVQTRLEGKDVAIRPALFADQRRSRQRDGDEPAANTPSITTPSPVPASNAGLL